MSAEANKATSRRFLEEVFSQGNLDATHEIVATDHVNGGPGALPGLPGGPEGSKMLVTTYRTAFPDIQFKVEDQIAEGDKVMTRWTGVGTHQGDLGGIPATGKSSTVTGILVDRYADGKIVETWGIFDQFGMMQQLGVIPSQG